MNLYLLPIEQRGHIRAPRYLRSRILLGGLDVRWSLKDFGHTSSLCLVAIDNSLKAPDAHAIPRVWSQSNRDRLGGYLRSGGIDASWILKAGDWREAWQRLAGMTQVLQSVSDDPFTNHSMHDPSVWLGRKISFGFDTLMPLDMKMFHAEREAKRWRIGDWALYGREWVNQKTGKLVPLIAGGALPATDTFTTGSNSSLTAYSANWSANLGTIQVLAATDDFSGNTAAGDAGGFQNVETYNNDQYGQIVVNAISDAGFVGVTVRNGAGGVGSYYGWYEADSSDYLFKEVAGTFTGLGSIGAGGSVSDTLRIEASGTTITPKRNGSTPGTPGAQTDSSLSSGKAGIATWGDTIDSTGDNFEGGNLVGLSLEQEGFRWRTDDGSESAATWLANQDTNISRAASLTTRLRMLVNATSNPASQRYKLRYRKVGDDGWRDLNS